MQTFKDLMKVAHDPALNALCVENSPVTLPVTPTQIFKHIRRPEGLEALPYRFQQSVAREAANWFNIGYAYKPLLGSCLAYSHAAGMVICKRQSIAYQKTLQRCGAKTRKGQPCKMRDLGKSGRCKFHGGKSTGPKTKAGRERSLQNLVQYRAAPQS